MSSVYVECHSQKGIECQLDIGVAMKLGEESLLKWWLRRLGQATRRIGDLLGLYKIVTFFQISPISFAYDSSMIDRKGEVTVERQTRRLKVVAE